MSSEIVVVDVDVEFLRKLREDLGLTSWKAFIGRVGCSQRTLEGWIYEGKKISPAYISVLLNLRSEVEEKKMATTLESKDMF